MQKCVRDNFYSHCIRVKIFTAAKASKSVQTVKHRWQARYEREIHICVTHVWIVNLIGFAGILIPAIARTINWGRESCSPGAIQATPHHAMELKEQIAADWSTGHLMRSFTQLTKCFLSREATRRMMTMRSPATCIERLSRLMLTTRSKAK